MAKSIRSKVKKRNRTEMRKTVGDPHQRMLQARCTAKIQNSVALGCGKSISKLKMILNTAQERNPPTKEKSKSNFSFRHPDAPPVFNEVSLVALCVVDNKGSMRGLSGIDVMLSVVFPAVPNKGMKDDPLSAQLARPWLAGVPMGNVARTAARGAGDEDTMEVEGGPAGAALGRAHEKGINSAHGRQMAVMKEKKKLRQARRRGFVDFPALDNSVDVNPSQN